LDALGTVAASIEDSRTKDLRLKDRKPRCVGCSEEARTNRIYRKVRRLKNKVTKPKMRVQLEDERSQHEYE
jgi:hypothetical protein